MSCVPSTRWRAYEWIAWHLSRYGERRSIDWLTYNPLQLGIYHRLALEDAPAVAQSVMEVFPSANSFADIGAGSGAYAAEFKRHGRSVQACEFAFGGRLLARAQRVPVTSFDLRRSPPARLRTPVDIAYCFEVAEHVRSQLSDRLVAFLATLAPVVIFTAAKPGQGGLGHINEQPPEYWVDRFRESGFRCSGDTTEVLREAFRRNGVSAQWFHENLLVFGRQNGVAESSPTRSR